ncbi:hypothetical protein B0T18DRAFT_418525 [Schizothecium vesticola]|uniref:Uncharacterized protein n=1 Tax=Schizothecium vesticola TaxID=314040 RepID=A0AA40EJW4_9PEZI|nr:hypothetical protein B0T18DRAFT_418525 [Schizothecium vesticola]
MSTHTHRTAATGGLYELSTPTTAAFPHRMPHHAGPFYHLDDDDKSTRTLTMGMGTRPGSSVGVGGGRSRTNTMRTARSEETAARVRVGEEEAWFPSELAGNAKVHMEGSGSGEGPAVGPGVGLGIQRPQSLVPPPPIGGGGARPVSTASSSAGWTVMRREGVQATPWL